LEELLRGVDLRDFAIHLWDGTDVAPAKGQPKRFTLVIQHAGDPAANVWLANLRVVGF